MDVLDPLDQDAATTPGRDLLDTWTLTDRIGTPPPARWLDVAREVAATLAVDVIERDQRGAPPFAEVQLLRDADLLPLLVPRELGGHGEPYRTGLEVVRLIARVDASIAHLLAYHWAFQTRLNVEETPALRDFQRRSAEHAWVVGSTGTPLDQELEVEVVSEGLLLSGRKSFATAARVADRIVGFPLHPETGHRLLVELDTSRPELVFLEDWDMLGQRLTASNGLTLDRYLLRPEDVLGDLGRDDDPRPPSRSISILSFQLIFIFLYVGLSEGALLHAREYTLRRTRPWLHASVDDATEDPHILRTYGELVSRVQALAALADRAERAAAWALARGDELTAVERAEAASIGAAAKQVASDTVLDVTSRVWETTGARATQRSVGLDLYWRNARTHTLHSPVAYKAEEVARLFLRGELLSPSDYR
jgi:alkylation response protein AidB-like acyl-CoA dehydrogenase